MRSCLSTVIFDLNCFRTEYLTIVSIMVCMAVWDFVIGVLFGIIVSCTLPLAPIHLKVFISFRQACFSSCRVRKEGAFVRSKRAKRACHPYAVRACKENTSARCPSKRPSSNCKDSSSLEPSPTLRKRSAH